MIYLRVRKTLMIFTISSFLWPAVLCPFDADHANYPYADWAQDAAEALQSWYDQETGLWKTTSWWNVARAIAKAALDTFSDDNGILHESNEPHCNQDQEQFKGIFMRHLAALHQVSPDTLYKKFTLDNARSIRQNARDPETGQIGLVWSGPFDSGNAARQSSALDALNAAIRVTHMDNKTRE